MWKSKMHIFCFMVTWCASTSFSGLVSLCFDILIETTIMAFLKLCFFFRKFICRPEWCNQACQCRLLVHTSVVIILFEKLRLIVDASSVYLLMTCFKCLTMFVTSNELFQLSIDRTVKVRIFHKSRNVMSRLFIIGVLILQLLMTCSNEMTMHCDSERFDSCCCVQ